MDQAKSIIKGPTKSWSTIIHLELSIFEPNNPKGWIYHTQLLLTIHSM